MAECRELAGAPRSDHEQLSSEVDGAAWSVRVAEIERRWPTPFQGKNFAALLKRQMSKMFGGRAFGNAC
jgi:hypothetical protein